MGSAPVRRPLGRLAAAALAAVWLSVAWSPPPLTRPVAAAARVVEDHRAAVIIDTGTEVKSVCVRFQEESISGIEALARARVDPVLQAFSGKGAAVCALCGVGCAAGDSCLTCDPDGRFWSYSRAPAGTTALRTSGVGASSTIVRDGDVEGWRWALGGAPPFDTVQHVCGEAAVATSTTAAPPPAPTTAATSAGQPKAPPPPGATETAVATTAAVRTTTTAAGAASATAPPAAAAGGTAPFAGDPRTGRGPMPPGRRASTPASGLSASPAAADGEAGNWTGLALFAAVLAGLVAWGGWARRARRRAGTPST